MSKLLKFAMLAVSAAALSACGGGGDDAKPAPSNTGGTSAPKGLWEGTITGTNRAVKGLVLSDGTYYVLYSAPGNPNSIAGVVQGSGTTNGNSFTSSNARDFSLEDEDIYSASVSTSFVTKQSFNGTVSYGGSDSASFTTSYDTDFDLTPTLSAVAGTFSGQIATSEGFETGSYTVSSNGAISGTSSGGCATTGTVTPRTDGNAYNLSLTFGAAPCHFANQTIAGVAYYSADDRRLFAVGLNSARNDGVLFVGTKP